MTRGSADTRHSIRARARAQMMCAIAITLTAVTARAQDVARDPIAVSARQAQTVGLESEQPQPITGRERVAWIVDGVAGPRNLGMTALSQSSETWFNTPEEQARLSNFARGFAIRELDLAISRSVEAGLGAMWGEDPRPSQTVKLGVWPKTQNAMRMVVLARRSDGHLAPAWGRLASHVASGVAANLWLPENERTPKETALRVVDTLASRFVENLWKEFWPDIKARLPEPPWAKRTADKIQ